MRVVAVVAALSLMACQGQPSSDRSGDGVADSLDVLQARMDSAFQAALAHAGTLSDSADAVRRLRAEQEARIQRLDCPEDDVACRAEALRRRTVELQVWYRLVESSGVTFWQCGDNPADEFVTEAFATDPPAVRIERGDQSAVAVATPSASGVRYEATGGRVFWQQEDEARFEWGGTAACRVRLRR